jgi:hypothetical protein
MAKGDWKVIHCTVDEAETKLAEVPGGFTLVACALDLSRDPHMLGMVLRQTMPTPVAMPTPLLDRIQRNLRLTPQSGLRNRLNSLANGRSLQLQKRSYS